MMWVDKNTVLRIVGWALCSMCASAGAMDLQQVYRAAREQEPGLAASRATVQATRERLAQAQAQFLPVLSMSASRNDNRLVSTTANFFGNEQTSDSAYRSSNESVTLRQPLLRAGLLAQRNQAQAQIDESEANFIQDEQDLASRVSGAYFEVLLAQEQLALLKTQLEAVKTQLEAAKKAFAGGLGTRTDIDDAQARLDMTQAQMLEGQAQIDYTRRQLQAFLDDPIGDLAKLDATRLEPARMEVGTLESWLDRAQQSSPRLKALAAQVEQARQEVSRSGAGHWPSLDLVGQWTRSVSENVQSVNSRYTNASVGFQLTIPVYSGGYVSATQRQALAALERAEHAQQAGMRDLQLRVQKEYRSVVEGVPRIQAYEQALRSAEQMARSNRMSWKAGSRTVVDVLNAEQQRMMAQRDLTQARLQFLAARVRLMALADASGEVAIAEINPLLSP